jgi:hypothetical protein
MGSRNIVMSYFLDTERRPEFRVVDFDLESETIKGYVIKDDKIVITEIDPPYAALLEAACSQEDLSTLEQFALEGKRMTLRRAGIDIRTACQLDKH